MDSNSNIETRARALLALYDEEIAPALREHPVISTEPLEQTRRVLEQALKGSSKLRVGFVGASQVGKSSIINALLGRRVVPAGGIGPLTAQATTLEYRKVNALEVRYHGGDQLNRLALGIRSYLTRRGELHASANAEAPVTTDLEVALDADLAPTADATDTPKRRTSEVGEHMLAQARLLLTRPGDSRDVSQAIKALSNTNLLDAVRLVLEQPTLSDPAPLEPFRDRVREIASVLGTKDAIQENAPGSGAFARELRIRAAGHLSPLIASLQLHLDERLLEDVELVDLPGVGNVADPGARVAEEFVANPETGGLVIVFRNNGLTKDVVDILERAGVFRRLLWASGSSRPPLQVVVAITYVDSVALERFNEEFQSGEAQRSPEAIFAQVAGEMTDKIRHDLQQAIETHLADEARDGMMPERQIAVRRELAESLQIVCVDAKDFLQIAEKQPVGIFLSDADATNVPRLRASLQELGATSAIRREQTIAAAAQELHGSLVEAVRIVSQTYEAGGGTATTQWERFRERLARDVEPLKRSLEELRGSATRELQQRVPEEIATMCSTARESGRRKLKALKSKGETLYWASLNAALTRGGVWEGQRLDYPGSLTAAFVDSVAENFEKRLVETVRTTVAELSKKELRLVEDVCRLALAADASLVVEAHVDAQKAILRRASGACIKWTSERLEKLREEIQGELLRVVKKPIEAACAECIADGNNRGKGASIKILAAFEVGGIEALEKAEKAAAKLLLKFYEQLRTELETGYFREHHDPVSAAVQALTGEERERASAADHEARRRVMRKTKALATKLEVVLQDEPHAA